MRRNRLPWWALAVLSLAISTVWWASSNDPQPATPAVGAQRERLLHQLEFPLSQDETSSSEVPGGRTSSPSAPSRSVAAADREASSDTVNLRFEVVDPRGAVQPTASVIVVFGPTVPGESFRPVSSERLACDSRGAVTFSVAREDPDPWSVQVHAEEPAGLSSDVLFLEPPLDRGPHRLVLWPGASLRMRVLEHAAGAPIEGSWLSLEPADFESKATMRIGRSDAAGEHVFGPLPPGSYRYYAGAPSSENAVQGTVELFRGSEEMLEVSFGDEERGLALSGIVVDLDGAPVPNVGLWAGADRSAGQHFYSSGDGRFEAYMPRCDELWLRTFEAVDTHAFAPTEQRVVFGTRDLVLRQVEERSAGVAKFRVIDATSRQPLEAAWVTLYLVDAMGAQERYSKTWRRGSIEIEFKRQPNLKWVAYAPGYRHERGWLDAEAEEIEVRLTKGSGGSLRVCDADTEEAITGVELTDADGGVRGRASADGTLSLDGLEGRLRLSHPDYLPGTWYASWIGEVAFLRHR